MLEPNYYINCDYKARTIFGLAHDECHHEFRMLIQKKKYNTSKDFIINLKVDFTVEYTSFPPSTNLTVCQQPRQWIILILLWTIRLKVIQNCTYDPNGKVIKFVIQIHWDQAPKSI